MGRYDFLLHATPDNRPAASPVERPSAVASPAPTTPPALTSSEPSVPENTPAVAAIPPRAAAPDTTITPSRQSPSRMGKRPPAAAPTRGHAATQRVAVDDAGLPMPNAAAPLRSNSGSSPARQPFDASARADQKYTLAFTEEELEAMEDVKLELRRRYDLKTTKVALVRWGLWELIADYRQQGEHSRLVTRLKTQQPAQNRQGETLLPTEERDEHSV